MIVIGRRLMRIRLQENFAAAKTKEKAAQEEEQQARKKLGVATGRTEVTVAEKELKKATESLKTASNEVKKYGVRKEENENQDELARLCRRRGKARVVGCAELGDKLCPFTEYGKNYTGSQLRDLYKHVGQYGLGLPAFGPNILRTIHVTSVMTVCYQLGIPQSDDRVLNHFALGRHGEYEMKKAYNLAKADNSNNDPNSFSSQISGVIGTLGFNDACSEADYVQQQNAALEKWIGKSKSCWYDKYAITSTGDGSFEGVMAMWREMFSKQMVDDPETASLRKKKEKMRLEASILNSEASKAESKVRKRKAEIELQSLGDGGVSSVPRVQAGSGLVSDGNVGNMDKAQRFQKRRKTQHRATRHTYTGDKVPLLLSKMNALFVQEVRKKGYLPRELPDVKVSPKGSAERDLEIGLKKIETFGGMCKDVCRYFMQGAVAGERGDGSEVVKEFYSLSVMKRN